MRPADRRTARTRKALRNALLILLRTRDYDDFSVNDLLEVADVGRSTFYDHFTGKDDLLRYGLKMLGDEIREELRASGKASSLLAFSLPLFEHVNQNRQLYRHLKGRGGEVWLQTFGQVVGDLIKDGLGAFGSASISELQVQYIRGAFLGMMTWWLDHSTNYSVGEVDELFKRMSSGGIQDDVASASV